MKKRVGIAIGWLMLWGILGITPLQAQEEVENYFTVTGVVKDKENKKKLENVNVSVPGTNIGTVTNSDGVFALKIKDAKAPGGWKYLTSDI